MQLLKKTILASVIAALLPIASFAQTEEVESADDTKVDVASYWTNNNEEALESAFEDYSLSWGSYITSLGHETEESTRFSDLFHAFTADFTNKYGMQPQQAPLNLLQDYYAQRKNSYGGELLLPTMAVWKNRPMLSIVPLPDQLDSYWGNPEQAGDTYDFMASIDHEDTLYFMGSHMGAFFGHPDKRQTLERFWKKWMKRKDSSAAKQDVDALKRIMLAEVLSHDAEYAVQELAAKKVDLWPALYAKPVTVEEQARVREIISDYCLKDKDKDPFTITESCMNFAKYADHFEYTNDIVQEIRNRLAKNKTNNSGYDEIYNSSTTYVIVDPDLLWPYDPWYGWYYQGGSYIYWHVYRPFIYPWYWRYWNPWRYRHHPPVVIGRPGHHRPPTIHHGHRPPTGHGHGGHNHGLRPGGHNHRPGGNHYNGGFGGGNRPNPGATGHRPGGNRPGGHGGNGGNPGHNPGGNGNGGHGNGHNPGHNPGGNGNGGHGNGHNPGHNPGGNGNGGHGNPGGNPGANPGNNNGGHANPGITVRPPAVRDNSGRTAVEHRGATTRMNPGNIRNHTGASSGYNGGSSRPSSGHSTVTPPSSRPSGSSYGGSSRPSTVTPSRSSGNSGSYSRPSIPSSRPSSGGFSGSRPSGGFSSGSSRPSGGFSSGSSRSSGGFSGGSHGGSSGGSHGGSHGGGHGGRH